MMQRHHVVNGHPRHLHGWKPQKDDPRDLMLVARHDELSGLAAASDLRPSLSPVIEDQSTEGACTGEGTTTVAEAALRKEGLIVELAPQFAYNGARLFEGTPLSEDSGCEIRDVIKFEATTGLVTEADFPYDPDNLTRDPRPLYQKAAAHRVLFYYACESDRLTKASLCQGWPVVFGFNVPNSMMTEEVARTGLVHHMLGDEGYAGGHCVAAFGHDDRKVIGPDTGAWLCANSWGKGWALDGFFWLSYACRPRDRWTMRRVAL